MKNTPELDGRAWFGKAEAYGTTFIVELFESRKHPGYYHYAIHCVREGFYDESAKPISAREQAGVNIWTFIRASLTGLDEYGPILDLLEWEETKPEELPLSGEKVKAGA